MNRYQYLNGAGEHVHMLDQRPLIGTSKVGGILAKPLSWYGSGMAVQALGVPDPKVLTKIKNKRASQDEITEHRKALEASLALIKGMSIEQFAALIDTAYRAHDTYFRSRAKTGTDLHAELERFVIDHMKVAGMQMPLFTNYDEKINPFIEWTNENVKRFLWAEGHCFSEKMWTGGICDVGYERKDGTFGIGDFKSAKAAYFEHFTQIAAYDIQISENGVLDPEGNLIYTLEKPVTEYIVVPFGADEVVPQRNFDQEGMRDTFRHMLAIYKRLPQD